MSGRTTSLSKQLTISHRRRTCCKARRNRRNMTDAMLHQIESLLGEMSRAEKAQVLQWIARDLGDAYPGIESIPGVSGGEPCIVRTRIPVWVLVQARNLGISEADLLRDYPTLYAEDLANAWAHYRSHRAEIGAQIHDNEMA